LKALLEALARGLVSDPGRVFVTEAREPDRVSLLLCVAPEDRGRVIGREGRTADALRTLLDAVARRRGQRCSVEIEG
jgi:uncharacterized protein